jgi:hypothetical protein
MGTARPQRQFSADPDEIRRAVALICDPGSVYELRVPASQRGTESGYFANFEALVAAATRLSGQAPGIFVMLNPVAPALLARSVNRTVGYAKHTTSDSDIVCRRWILLDFDPERPAGISSTDDEHDAAVARATNCRAWLIDHGIPSASLVLADSGNGAHLLIRVEL